MSAFFWHDFLTFFLRSRSEVRWIRLLPPRPPPSPARPPRINHFPEAEGEKKLEIRQLAIYHKKRNRTDKMANICEVCCTAERNVQIALLSLCAGRVFLPQIRRILLANSLPSPSLFKVSAPRKEAAEEEQRGGCKCL